MHVHKSGDAMNETSHKSYRPLTGRVRSTKQPAARGDHDSAVTDATGVPKTLIAEVHGMTKSFADQFRYFRKRRGTQTQAAKAAGVSDHSIVSLWEKGRPMPVERLGNILGWLHLSDDEVSDLVSAFIRERQDLAVFFKAAERVWQPGRRRRVPGKAPAHRN